MVRPVAVLACLAILLPAASATAQRMTVAYLGPDSDPTFRQVLLPWARAVRAESRGAANPQLMPDGLLGRDAARQATLVDQGQADLAWVRTDQHMKHFPDDGVFRLPGLVTSVRAGAPAAWSLMASGMLRGYGKYKVVAYVAGPPARLAAAKTYTTMRQVRLGRWQIGVSSPEAALGIASLPARPERVPQDRIGYALTEQVIVAALVETHAIRLFDGKARYKQIVDLPGGAPTFALIMDRKKYVALPAAARAALDKFGGAAFARRYAAAITAADRAALAGLTAGGRRKLVQMSDKDREEWARASAKAQAAWAGKHPNGQALLDALRGALGGR